MPISYITKNQRRNGYNIEWSQKDKEKSYLITYILPLLKNLNIQNWKKLSDLLSLLLFVVERSLGQVRGHYRLIKINTFIMQVFNISSNPLKMTFAHTKKKKWERD